MDDFTLHTTTPTPYDATLERVRGLLHEAGFGVLTEIDMAATLAAKLDVETAPRTILGACRPPLAHRALQADPRIAAMLPCNVVVSATDDGGSLVEIFDPVFMTSVSDDPELAAVATEARDRLSGMLDALEAEN
ncbi:MAG: DUF302 domain-containing protein [Actinobacteria bacterium]|nr:DUF302 domain-containing protein [Actinomycetota bacterium]